MKRTIKLAYKISAALLALLAIGAIYFVIIIKDLPNPELLENRQVAESTKVYDRTGEVLLYEIHGEERRTVISFDEIPDYIKQATIAIEDVNFYEHPAFDLKSIFRAVLKNISRGWGSQGGSTITQQLAKNAFLTPEKTITRKIKELALSFRLEKRFTKDEILNLYLNQIPYGSNAYGVEAASQTFFEKTAQDLTIPEAALLASLPQAPSYYSPYGSHISDLMARKDLVLDRMHEAGYITENEKLSAQKYNFEFAPQSVGLRAPHFVITIQEYLNEQFGEDVVRTSGFKVITTLDWELQQLAERVVREGAERNKNLYSGHNAALVAQDANTGQVLALVGSKDYFAPPEPENCRPGIDCRFEGNFNVATQGLRQPGSAMKPLAYVAAFQKGYSPETIVFDVPTEFAASNPKCPLTVDFSNNEDSCFHPHNFDEFFRGPVSLRNSLAQSINVPSVKTLYLAGIDNVLNLAKDFGIKTLTERSRYGLSLVLGGGEIKLIELVGAYSVFAQEGKAHKQSLILEIKDGKNRIRETYKDEVNQVIEPQYTRLINDVLSDVEARSALFSSSLNLTVYPGYQVALKTGTTNDYRDAWAIGYNPSLVVGVWAGNNNNEPMQRRAGSILAAIPMWHNFLVEALKTRPAETFTPPEPAAQQRPMLNGQHIINYVAGGKIYPQIHNLLYYIDRNSAQFDNWEEPVINWAMGNIINFDSYNQIVPSGASVDNSGVIRTDKPYIQIISPLAGDFIDNKLDVEFQVTSIKPLSKIEVHFNGNLLNTSTTSNSTHENYKLTFSNLLPKQQNLLKIIASDNLNNISEKEIIVYSK
ncbi:MAG: transglycosylase domain-containing protein [bacterium]|nr:transglycosylase domain-containing protein [bacterium]